MKQTVTIISIFLIFSVFSKAQTIDIITDLVGPRGIAFKGNDLYIVESIYGEEGRIIKINITDPSPVPDEVIGGLNDPRGVLVNGTKLYFTEFNLGKVQKIDINIPNPNPLDVCIELSQPCDLALLENTLYISEYYTGEVPSPRYLGRVSKKDLIQPNASTIEIASELGGPLGLSIQGNFLYISEDWADRISRLDITANSPILENVITDVISPFGSTIYENKLYVASNGNFNKILKIDIEDPYPDKLEIASIPGVPTYLCVKGDDLYISEFSGKKISKLFLPGTGIENYDGSMPISIYPNPAHSYFNITNLLCVATVKIYNMHGKIIKQEKVQSDEKIEIGNLSKGLYLVAINNDHTFKLIKKN